MVRATTRGRGLRWGMAALVAGAAAGFLGAAAPAQAIDLGGEGRGCVFGYKFGIDLLVPGYNPGPYPAYCPPPVAVYPAPPVATPTAPLILATEPAYFCTVRSALLAGKPLSSLSGLLCGGDSVSGSDLPVQLRR